MRWRTLYLIPTALAVGTVLVVAVDSSRNRTKDAKPSSQSTPSLSTPTKRVGEITALEQSGEMHSILERHRQMLEQMQEDASPAMLQLMNNDQMWKMMRSPQWASLDEQHQADINRMLAKGNP